MPNISEISVNRFGSKYWMRYQNYSFAAREPLAPVVSQELSHLISQFALAFSMMPTGPRLVALMGLQVGDNAYVAPDGRWLGRYVPAVLRSYPFGLLHSDGARRSVCVDLDSGLVSDDPARGERFFMEDGTLSPALQEVVGFLQAYETNRLQTEQAGNELQKLGLLEPWPLAAVSLDGSTQKIEGLLRVHEADLARLSGDELVRLRDSGGLVLAYAQLFSMANIKIVQELTQAQQTARRMREAAPPVNAKGELDLEFLNSGGTLDFSRLL